jgi:hypothetical protein
MKRVRNPSFTIFVTVALAVLCARACFAQTSGGSPKAPRLILKLPDNIAPDSVWIRYLVDHRISRGERMQLEGDSREYVILRVRNPEGQPENVKIVLYSPGCEFKVYDLNLLGDSDVEKRFQCDPLPVKKVHGFIPVTEIPRAIYSAIDKRVDVVGELEAEWMCSFFLGPNGGSCLSSGVPLNILGTIDPADEGRFEITIPDFSLDPAFRHAERRERDFDVIEMLLRDHKVDVTLGGIKPKESTSPIAGLKVQAEYPDPVVFTKMR